MKLFHVLFAITIGMLFGVTTANAALPVVVGTTLTDIQTDGLALINLLWPVIGVLTGAFVLIRIFKRGSSKL